MPRRAKGPRLWLRPPRRDGAGRLTHPKSYFILDNGRQIGIGCADLETAEQALSAYIAQKHKRQVGARDPERIKVADVIELYAIDIAPTRSRPEDAARRLGRILEFFGADTLADINGARCRAYARQSSTDTMARRDLEDLRAAINHHRQEGLHDRIISVVLPERRPPRERWLSRQEAARLLWAAWRRPKCKHVARFILIALATGRRASVVCSASFMRETGRSWIDLRTGFLWPPERARLTKKRNPPIPLSGKLLVHLRAWRRNGARYPVEWGGHTVTRIDPTMKEVALAAGLGEEVTPHVLRHTAATWQMQAGVDIWEAGKYLGMTARTLENVYGHHRPEQLISARDAHHRHRQRYANETREPKANKKAQPHAKKRDHA